MANSPSKYSIFASLEEDKIFALSTLLIPGHCTFRNCPDKSDDDGASFGRSLHSVFSYDWRDPGLSSKWG
jgi:hypothetical protein